MNKRATNHHHVSDPALTVWGERRPEPDWDRYLAALIALALRRVEERRTEPADEPEEARG